MHYLKSINLLILSLVFLSLIHFSFGQPIKPLTLGETIEGRMEIDEAHEYFEMNITKVDKDSVLIFETQENKKEQIKTDEVFSDPDFYISKVNKYPASKRSSEWYSERYGTDVLAIPSSSLKEGDILYVGMYCQFKCRYFFRTYFAHEFELKLNEFQSITVKAHETMKYKLHIADEFEELSVVAYSKNAGKFRLFMNKVNPSSQNTFNVIPSWINGYIIQVQKTNQHQYCTKCDYHILIQNEGSEDINQLVLTAIPYGKVVTMPREVPFYDAINPNMKRCYAFNITKEEKEKEQLIIQTTLFSGDIALAIKGWQLPDDDNKPLETNNEYVHKIITEHFVILTKKDFDKFDTQIPQFQGKDSTLHFCVYSKPESSFVFSTYYLTQLEKLQKKEPSFILFPGSKVRSHLLKDQKMVYELAGHNLEKVKYDVQTNITVSTFDLAGTTKSYIYFCQVENCTINRNQIEEYISNGLIKPIGKKNFEKNELLIQNSDNACYKKPNITLPNGNIINCQTLALIFCETPSQEGLCSFDVQHIIEDDPLLMIPKKIYYGSLPLGKSDFYNIVINDKNVHSLVVVLNSESGDSDLLLYEKAKGGKFNSKEGTLKALSYHSDYIPDVLRLTPAILNREDIIGDYLVKIKPTTFSSYSLYYYVTYNIDKNETNKVLPEVTLDIEIGQVITDYFPCDIRYKIYSFTPFTEQKKSIRVFIDRVNIDFNIYIFSDYSTLNILPFYRVPNEKGKEIITGYDWRNDGGNDVTILSDDPKFFLDHTYYIVISPNITEVNRPDLLHSPPNEGREEKLETKAAIQFYLGVTEAEEEISISEGVPHSMILDQNYTMQVYYYEHTDINTDFELEINVYSGEIDIFIDIDQINLDKIKDLKGTEDLNKEGTMFYKLGVLDSYDSIIIPSDYFKSHKDLKNGKDGIGLYFLIKRSKSSVDDNVECKYTIVQFSSESHDEILQPGLTKSSVLAPGEKAFYVIEEPEKRKGSTLTVTFSGGIGNVYVRIPEKPEVEKRFPSIDNYDYIGESIFTSKIVSIPEEAFKKITSANYKLQILVTVEVYKSNQEPDPNNPDKIIQKDVLYTIAYANEPKSISQNTPFEGVIKKGEFQYYRFYFDDSTENIYIGLFNMDGDADMYLDYGNSLPTPSSFDWKANQANHEYIDLNVKDKFFTKNQIEDISGYYTLLIAGFVNTTFTLFVSTHKDPVLPLRNNRPVTCVCEGQGEKCYLRYNEVFDRENIKKGIKHNEIVFTNKYSYGSGIMYAKVVKDFELHGKDFYKSFPTETDYTMSNKESKQKTYMKMQISGTEYTEDSSILMTYVCKEKTRVSILSTSLRHYNSIDYIGENKENTFYLSYNEVSGEKPQLDLYFYNFEIEQDLVYNIHSFVGDAHFVVYANESKLDINTQQTSYQTHIFREFDVTSMNYTDSGIDFYNPYSKDYHYFIGVDEQSQYESIIFKVIPKSEFGFSIMVNYDKNWNYIPLGSSTSYYARHHEYFGFFDVTNEISEVEINFSVEENVLLSADVYVKINIIDKTKKKEIKGNEQISEFSLYDYSYPTEKNYDYFSSTDPILGSMTLTMKNLPKLTEEQLANKFVRVLIYARIRPADFEPIDRDEDDEEEIGRMKKMHRDWEHWNGEPVEENVFILITPAGFNSTKYVKANPYEYYFHNLTYSKGEIRLPQTKIYGLKRLANDHNILVIEISACLGSYSIQIYDKLILDKNDMKSADKIEYSQDDKYGKTVYYVHNLKSDIYYLAITPKKNSFLCSLKGQNEKSSCAVDLTYLMHYYTTKKKSFIFTVSKTYIIHPIPYKRGKALITLPNIITKNIDNNITEIQDYKFDVFISKEEYDFDRMGSVCVLCKYNNTRTNEGIKKVNATDIKIKVNKENKYLIIGGLGYRNKYYINILVQNTKTKELLTFYPSIVWSGGILPFALWQTGLGNLVVIGLVVALVIVCRKYCSAKEELKEIKGDTLPKTESELSHNNQSEGVRYSGLGESY